MKLTQENYKRLAQLDMCNSFRQRLEAYAPLILLNGSAEIPLKDIEEAKVEANNKQKELLEDIFRAPFKNPYKVGDKIKVVNGGGNDTDHKECKNRVEKGDVIEISHFSTYSNGTEVVAVSTEGHVVYIEQYPEKFKLYKPSIKVGKWYADKKKSRHLWFVTETRNEGSPHKAYGFNGHGVWSEEDWRVLYGMVEAPRELVEQKLIEEANRRGYEGNKIKSEWISLSSYNISDRTMTSNYTYGKYSGLLERNGDSWTIFKDGEWAEIVKEETYSVGDRFKMNNIKYILCRTDYEVTNKVNLVNLKDGNLWTKTKTVEDRFKITQKEFNDLSVGYKFTKIN